MNKGMSTIKYEIEFFSHWHCGSGLAAGADVDALVIKDEDGLPYVPGRTVKGLLRDAATDLGSDQATVNQLFGVSGEDKNHEAGASFFGNAVLPAAERAYITDQKLQSYMFQSFSSTKIDENGIAKDHSLRKIETVVPCKLEGKILNVPDGTEQILENAMHFVKRMGTGRNRGYGRCKITIRKEV